MKNMKNEGVRAGWMAGWLALTAFIVAITTTATNGVGMGLNSAEYLQVARNLVLGNGFTVFSKSGGLAPLVSFPPVYPFFLSAGNFLGMDFPSWAAWLSAICFAVNLSLMTLIAFYLTGRRRSALLTGLSAIVSVHMVEGHMGIACEPLFLSFMIGSLWLLMLYLERGSRKLLIFSAGLASLAALTHYAGLALIVAGVCVLFLRSRRVSDVVIYFVVAAALPLGWLTRAGLFSGQLAGHTVTFYPPTFSRIFIFPDTLASFLLPEGVPWPLRWIVLAAFLAFLVYIFLRSRSQGGVQERALRVLIGWQVLGSFICVYIVGVFLASLFISSKIILDWRMLLPVCAALMILAPFLLDHRQLELAGKRLRGFTTLFLVFFLTLGFLRTARLVKDMYSGNYRYSMQKCSATEMAKNVRSLADDVPVYADDPAMFYFFAGRPAIKIPVEGENIAYLPKEERIREDFTLRRAVAIVFHGDIREHSRWLLLGKELPLSVFFKDDSGLIQGYRPKPAGTSAPVNAVAPGPVSASEEKESVK